MTAQDRFDELVSDYLDGGLDDEGLTELSTLLVARAEYASRFVRLSRLHASLREVQAPELDPAKPSRWLLSAIVAVILAAILVLLVFRH
jgi:anti-sigma factor RsiW